MNKPELSPRQHRFVAAMMVARTVAEAAASVGVTERTAYKYLARREVKQALSDALDQAMSQATRLVVGSMADALETLQRIHTDEEAPSGSRVAAARAILASGPQLREALDIAERVAELEAKLQQEAVGQ